MKNCKLIATIPSLNDKVKVNKVISNPFISGARWNTGVVSPYNPDETLRILKDQCDLYNKSFWVDIKGRQLRVAEWGLPLYTSIKLNHNVKIEGEAKVYLRGEPPLKIVAHKNNEIFVAPVPRHAVGAGQSANIIADKLEIIGYLTDSDKEYLRASKELNINDIMASFVESELDLEEIKKILPDANIVCKIESQGGSTNLFDFKDNRLMAARDDLYIQLAQPYYMRSILQRIIAQDPDAICASRIFTSLEHSDNIEYSDFEDLETMYEMGYRTFMLCDNICNYHFEQAIKGWETFLNGR